MLLRNVRKSLGKKWMPLIGVGIILTLSSFIYTMMFYATSGTENPTRTYLRDCHQEDFAVEMLGTATEEEASRYPVFLERLSQGICSLGDLKKLSSNDFYAMMDERIQSFKDAFPDCSLELREFKKIQYEHEGKNHTALVLKDADEINLSYMEEGVRPASDGEIAVNRIYAEKNGIAIGDTLAIGDTEYTVSGFVLFPDYTLSMFDNTLNLDTALQTTVLMTDAAYERCSGTEYFRLSGTSKDGGKTETAFDSSELPFVIQITTTEGTLRSGAIFDAFHQNKAIAVGLSTFISLIALIIVSILIYNLLSAERGQIGILKALGYSRLQIAVPYFLAVLSFSLVMLTVGYVLGYLSSDYVKQMLLNFYLIPSVEITPSTAVFMNAVLVPFLSFAVISFLVIYFMLRKRALELLKPQKTKPVNGISRLVSRALNGAKGSTKFKYLYIFRNLGSFLIITLGILFSTVLLYFAFMATGMVERMTVDYLKRVDYEYESYIDPSAEPTETIDGQEKFLVYDYAYLDDSVITVRGLSPDNHLYKLYNTSGDDITADIQNGAVVTKRLSIKHNIRVGDTIEVSIKNATYSFTVKGIVDEYISDTVFVDIETLSTYLSDTKSKALYSGIYSVTKPSSDGYLSITSKAGIMGQSKAMEKHSRFMINVLIACASIIAASILFVFSFFTVEGNYYVISLLKVIGYSRREVNSMILDSYLVYTTISYLISIPVALEVLKRVMGLFVEEFNVVLPLQLKPIYTVISFVVLIFIFIAGTFASRRKIAKIPLQEVLKTYGE